MSNREGQHACIYRLNDSGIQDSPEDSYIPSASSHAVKWLEGLSDDAASYFSVAPLNALQIQPSHPTTVTGFEPNIHQLLGQQFPEETFDLGCTYDSQDLHAINALYDMQYGSEGVLPFIPGALEQQTDTLFGWGSTGLDPTFFDPLSIPFASMVHPADSCEFTPGEGHLEFSGSHGFEVKDKEERLLADLGLTNIGYPEDLESECEDSPEYVNGAVQCPQVSGDTFTGDPTGVSTIVKIELRVHNDEEDNGYQSQRQISSPVGTQVIQLLVRGSRARNPKRQLSTDSEALVGMGNTAGRRIPGSHKRLRANAEASLAHR